tara:strand:+ start:234 stop:389 length:156 start_codon:yes stop_codon:yes gene_type:complete
LRPVTEKAEGKLIRKEKINGMERTNKEKKGQRVEKEGEGKGKDRRESRKPR